MTQIADDIEVVVLAHDRKPAVTAEMLGQAGIPFRIYENPDWPWPDDHPELEMERTERPGMRGYALRQYRAFKGHQEILRSATTPYQMVFEDDASFMPDTTIAEVIQLINGTRRFISDFGYDAVSFHGRKMSAPKASLCMYGREFIELSAEPQEGWGHVYFLMPARKHFDYKYADTPPLMKWHEGALAYLCGPAGRQKWLDAGHGFGMPDDLFLVNEMNTIVMRETVFEHDHRHGSLIANTGRSKRSLNADGTAAVKVE